MNDIMEKDIGDEITYYEYHMQYLKKELDEEEIYRAKVKNRKEKYRSDLLISSGITLTMFFILVFLILLYFTDSNLGDFVQTEQQMFLVSMGTSLKDVGSIFLALVPGAIFIASLIWTIWGITRIRGMKDPKTLRYERYDVMHAASEQRTIYLQRELLETTAKSEAAKWLQAEKRNSMIESKEMKTIAADELKEILEEKKKKLE